MHIHTSEYPRVAHIVADVDAIESDMNLNLSFGMSAKPMFDVRTVRPSLRRTVWQRAISLSLVLVATACSSTGATFRSGVGDAFLEKAPYYAGASASTVRESVGKVAHAPIVFQSGATQAPMFDPETAALNGSTILPGVEMGQLPTPRTWGANLTLKL